MAGTLKFGFGVQCLRDRKRFLIGRLDVGILSFTIAFIREFW